MKLDVKKENFEQFRKFIWSLYDCTDEIGTVYVDRIPEIDRNKLMDHSFTTTVNISANKLCYDTFMVEENLVFKHITPSVNDDMIDALGRSDMDFELTVRESGLDFMRLLSEGLVESEGINSINLIVDHFRIRTDEDYKISDKIKGIVDEIITPEEASEDDVDFICLVPKQGIRSLVEGDHKRRL